MTGAEVDLADHFAAVAAEHPRCVWLDGGGGRERSGRRSRLAWLDPDDVSLTYDAARCEVVRHAGGRSHVVGDDVFAVLEAELAAGRPTDRWFGYLGYAARPDLPARPDPWLPDAVWMRPSHVRVVDHPAGPVPGAAAVAAGTAPSMPASYGTAFARVQEHLRAGDTYEVNLTRRLEVASDLAAPEVYRRLRALNPAPYAAYLQHHVPGSTPAQVVGSSPERYARIETTAAGRSLSVRPIKGTTSRSSDPVADRAAHDLLAGHPRYRAESLMILDLLRHDLAGVCEVGSVEVPELLGVESYPTVHQLVSTVRGRLRPDVSVVAAVRALFPAGSMTGAPKLRTMSVIDAVEETPRGVYAGALGWVGRDAADLGVVIRSLVTTGDGTYRLGTGGGVTVHSDAESEWTESCWKADRLLAALHAEAPDLR